MEEGSENAGGRRARVGSAVVTPDQPCKEALWKGRGGMGMLWQAHVCGGGGWLGGTGIQVWGGLGKRIHQTSQMLYAKVRATRGERRAKATGEVSRCGSGGGCGIEARRVRRVCVVRPDRRSTMRHAAV